jgi:uncharacterized phiE125 gp8 family phage protein
MYAQRPIITRLPDPEPADILPLDLVKEFVGWSPSLDAEQDNVLPVLMQAAVEQGEQITGIVWAAAPYRIDGLYAGRSGVSMLLPLAPVFAVTGVEARDAAGDAVAIPDDAYNVIPSAIEFGRPWAGLWPLSAWPEQALYLSVTCTVGWTADALPASIRSWLLNRVAALYDMRSDIIDGTKSTTIVNMPRIHALGLLDRWVVRSSPYAQE